jgi:membrane associated rhomboid family serine protease
MFVLHSFMGPAVRLLGQEQFLAVYLTSAAFTSLISYAYKVSVYIL